MRAQNRAVLVLAALTALLLVPSTASAYQLGAGDFITCVAGGDNNVECVAGEVEQGCVAEIAVTDETGVVIATPAATGNADGELVFDFDVPADQPDGDLRVDIECNGKLFGTVIAIVTDGEVLANTGFDSMTLLLAAGGALALGGIILAATRRRTSRDA